MKMHLSGSRARRGKKSRSSQLNDPNLGRVVQRILEIEALETRLLLSGIGHRPSQKESHLHRRRWRQGHRVAHGGEGRVPSTSCWMARLITTQTSSRLSLTAARPLPRFQFWSRP